MENKEKKPITIKDFLFGLFLLGVGLGAAWGIIEGIEYLQEKSFAIEESFLFRTNTNFLYYLLIIIISFLIIPTFLDLLLRNLSRRSVIHYIKKFLPVIILCVPVAYLSYTSYVDFGEQGIQYDPFWPGEKKVFTWSDIDSVVIDKAHRRKRRFDYYIHFKDGTLVDIWGNTRMRIEELSLVDDKIRANGIQKYINDPPNESNIKSVFGKTPEKNKMIQKILRE